jgi:hypothetical protein
MNFCQIKAIMTVGQKRAAKCSPGHESKHKTVFYGWKHPRGSSVAFSPGEMEKQGTKLSLFQAQSQNYT